MALQASSSQPYVTLLAANTLSLDPASGDHLSSSAVWMLRQKMFLLTLRTCFNLVFSYIIYKILKVLSAIFNIFFRNILGIICLHKWLGLDSSGIVYRSRGPGFESRFGPSIVIGFFYKVILSNSLEVGSVSLQC